MEYLTPAMRRMTVQESIKRKQDLQPALALWWHDGSVTILCPYCLKLHRHGYNPLLTGSYKAPAPELPQSRLAHCCHGTRTSSLHYAILFPFENDERVRGLSYEIDKIEKRFRTVGIEGSDALEAKDKRKRQVGALEPSGQDGKYDETESTQLEDPTDQHRVVVAVDDGEEILEKESDMFLAHCVDGKTRALEDLLARSPDARRLIFYKRHDDSSTGLLMAVIEGHLETVKLLHSKGAHVNSRTDNGRTPLMEAALWGRTAVVQFLLAHGASKELRDLWGNAPIDLADESSDNEDERHRRLHPNDENNHYDQQRQRQTIKAILRGPQVAPLKTQRDSSAYLSSSHFHKSTAWSTISVVSPSLGAQVQSMSKVMAVLDRGAPFPRPFAVSGWVGPSSDLQLDNEVWTGEVKKICKAIDYDLPACDLDQGERGRYYACHAEKKLLSFFARKHCILADEFEDLSAAGLLELYSHQPAVTTATIFISERPCDDCKAFQARLQEATGINISLKVRPTSTDP